MRVTLATCEDWPEPLSDEPLRRALRGAGHEVSSAPWTSSFAIFENADVVLLRACWDYYAAPQAFLSWLDALEKAGVRVANALNAVRWNFDKRYMLDLHEQGINTVPSRVVEATDPTAIRVVMQQEQWPEAVIKPIHGQSGHFVQRLRLADAADWPPPGFEGPALLQPFQEDVGTLGETMMIFFAGTFSHACRRVIPPGEWRANSQYGTRRELTEVTADVVTQAARVIECAVQCADLQELPLYARVDGLIRADQFVLMELELIEPALCFELAPQKAEGLSDALTTWVETSQA